MNSIQEIEQAILELPQPDLRVLRGWFEALEAEIIVVPIEDVNDRSQHLQRILLNAPTLSEEELQPFIDVREWMNQWNVNNF